MTFILFVSYFFILASCILHLASDLHAGGALHYTNHWHDHQPLYWPNKTRASTVERWETAPENIDFGGSNPWAGHPANDIAGIFGLADRVAAYQSRCRDALSTITGYPEAGFTVSYTGALATNVKALGDQFRLGYSPSWNDGWKEARSWKTTGGKTRMDILLTGFAHSPLFPLSPDKTLSRRHIQLYKQIYPEIWGTAEPMSTGFWPLELAFSERMIPYLLDEGVTWTYFANSHLSRAMPNWPATPGNGMNTEPPNKADQYNPNGGQFGWRNATLDGRPTTNDLREAYRPHWLEYIDPETGASKKIIGVPAADYEGYVDGFQTFDCGLFDAIAGAQDPARPAMVVLAHDGDNAWGGGFDSYMTNTPNKASCASGKGYHPSSIAQYLADHPVPVNDVWHVEDGPWVNADSDFGSPTFANWNWPWKKDNLPNRPTFDPTAWDDNSQFWGVATAVTNRVLTAESYIGAPNMANVLHPENGTANAVEKAWHYLLSYMDSGHIYYGTSSDFSFIPLVNGNRAADFVDTVIGEGELSAGAADTVPPTIWVPQRFPYNPGSNNYGVAYNWRNFVYPSEFDVYTFVYDASGLQSVKLKWRTATGSNSTPVKPDNFTYAGGAAVSAWNEVVMSTSLWNTRVFLNGTEQIPAPITAKYPPYRAWAHVSPGQNKLVDYYVEAIDKKGNVQKTDILHVWVGDGSGATGGGGQQGSLWSPQSPTGDQQIKIAISTRNVSGATAGFLHWGVNNSSAPTGWKLPSSQYWPAGSVQCDAVSIETPLTAEFQSSIGITSYTITLGPFLGAQNVSEVNFVFHWGGTACTGGTWNNNGGANWAISVAAANNVPPAPPARITLTSRNQQIDVSWSASTSPSITGYNVYEWHNANSIYTKHNTAGLITGTTYAVTISTQTSAALVNGTTYTFVVTAYNTSINPESVFSVAVTTSPSATDISPPQIPINPTASGGVTQVSLSWGANLETDVQDYRIYVATYSGSFSTKVATKTVVHPTASTTITGLTANVTYYFQITARDSSSNESAPTFEVSAMAQSVPPPAAPTGLSATPGNTQATLNWNANIEGNLAGYNLYRSTVSGGPYSKVNGTLITTTTYTNTELTNGTQYFYRVTAVNTSASESAFSTQISVTPNTVIQCVFQVDMRGISNVTSVVIAQNTLAPTWSATGFPMTQQTGNLQGIWTITLNINPATAFQYKYVLNGTTWENDFGPAPNNNRSVAIAANNSNGKMYLSNKWNVAGDAIPQTPSGVSAQGLASGILVKWSSGTDWDIEKYNLYQSTWQANPNYTFSVSATSNSYLIGNLNTGTTYYFRTEAQDWAGQKSGMSGIVSAIANQNDPPAAPTGLMVSAQNVALSLSWSANTEPDLAGYLVNWGTNNGGPYPNQSALISPTTTIYTISGLTNGTTYFIIVRASDTAGNISANSSQVSAFPSVQLFFEERAIDGNFLDWKFSDVKALDPHSDQYNFNDGYDQSRDILALYAREGQNNYYFRVDFQELGIFAENSNLDLYLMLSWSGQSAGQSWLPDFADSQTDTPWKVGVAIYNATAFTIFNSTWGTENGYFNGVKFNSALDSVEFAIKKEVLTRAGWTPGTPLQMQCFTTRDGMNGGLGEIAGGPDLVDAAGITIDRGASFLNGFVTTNNSVGRAKYAFIYHGNQSINNANDIREWVYSKRSDGTTLVDTGFRLGLDTIDRYGVKANIHISGSLLSAAQWADPAFLSRIKTMVSDGKVGLIGGVLAEHIMPYFENNPTAGLYPNSRAIQARKDLIQNIFSPPQMPKVFWVPERVIRGTTFKDILNHPDTGQPTGYTATVLDDNYHMKDWFNMPLSQRFKLHKVNGVFVFLINGIDARLGLPQGGDTNPDGSKFWVQDGGAHIETRKTLLDLARSSDQEQLVLVFDDWEAYAGRSFTSALANHNAEQWDQTIGWIANHPWIETVTLDEILNRNWTAIDHGNNEGLPLKTYDWLSRACEWSYDNWYFGSAQEESFSNRIPKIKGATNLPNNKTYGHINTVGTLFRDAWDQIRNAPNNELKNYAEMVYNTLNFETAWHDEDNSDKFSPGSDTTWDAISGWALYLHGHIRHAAMIARAAQWAQNVSSGTQSAATVAEAIDVDLDGENEYVLRNNKVYAVFENDGGRLVMAFAYDPNVSIGGYQVIGAPAINYENEGEEIGTKHVHAFQEMNGGVYHNDAYSAQVWGSSITFTSSDGKVIKRIALADNSDKLVADYQETVTGALFVRFGLSPNARDLYRNGKNNLVSISSGSVVGARNLAGGQALLTLGSGVSVNTGFTDGTGDNTNSPHTKIFELSGDGNFTISLTLNNGGALDTTAPGAITNLVATTGNNDGEIDLTWTAPGDDGYTGNNDSTAKYLVRYATYPVSGGDINAWWQGATMFVNNWSVNAQGATENRTITGLARGTLYHLTVRTQDDANNLSGVQLMVSTYTKPDSTPPNAITTLTALTGTIDGSVILSWTAPGDDGTTGTAKEYDIRYSTTESLSPSISDSNFNSAAAYPSPPAPLPSGSTQSLTITALTPGVTYYFAMKSKDASIWSSLSNGATAKARIDDVPPAEITNLVASAGASAGQILLSWTAPGNDGTSGTAAIYLMKISSIANITNNAGFDGSLALTALSPTQVKSPASGGTAESMTVTGLVPGATYWFAIRARDHAGSTASWTASLTVNATNFARAALQSVTGFIGSTVSATSLRWTWVDIQGETGYQIVTDTGGPMSEVLSPNTTSYTETGLSPNQKAIRKLKALFDTLSSLSLSVTQYTLANPPTGTAISSVTLSTVTVTWDRNSNSTGTIFELRRATFSSITENVSISTRVSAPTSSYADAASFIEGVTYYYRLRTLNANGIASAFDTEASTLIARIVPSAITDLSALTGNTDGSVNLSWTAPKEDGATGGAVSSYIVKYATFSFDDTRWNDTNVNTAQSPPAPVAPGLKQTFTVGNLTAGMLYYFRIKSQDEGVNLSPIDSTSPQAQANAKISENLPKPPIYIAFLWHMHQPIYYPYENVVQTNDSGRYSFSVIDVHNSRTGPYTSWPYDAIAAGANAGLKKLGASVSFTGSLAENIKNINAAGRGFAGDWAWGYRNGFAWKTEPYSSIPPGAVSAGGGNARLDLIGFGYHHPLMGLIDYQDIRRQIRLHRLQLTNTFGVPANSYSKGIFPPENAFRPEMIPALADEGIEWVLVDSGHFDRTIPSFPWNSGGNLYEPNPADQINNRQVTWVQLQNLWAPTPVAVPFSYQPRYVAYRDPATGITKKIIAVPAARYEGNEDARGGFGALLYEQVMSQYEAYNTDARKPMLVVLHHDGDNYGGGSEQYYHSNFQNFVNWLLANPDRFVCTTIQDYLDMFPPDPNDTIHVENGSWAGADNGDPEFLKWNGEPVNGYSPDRNSWSIITAAKNRVDHAEAIQPPSSDTDILNGTGNDTAKALHYFYVGQASDYWYWDGTEIWDSNPVRAMNLAVPFADAVVNANPNTDPVGPAIYIPQRKPYNPGGKQWGITQPSSFTVWTFVYDVSGLSSVKLKYRVDLDGTRDSLNDLYTGGTWNELSMSARSFASLTNPLPIYKADEYSATVTGLNNVLVDYYVEATDTKGNVSRSPILHVFVGQGTGGTVPGALWSPPNPTQNDVVTIRASQPNKPGKLHWGVNNWTQPNPVYWPTNSTTTIYNTQAVQTVLLSTEAGKYFIQLGPFNRSTIPVSVVDFVFNYNDGSWDNNGGADWHMQINISTIVANSTPVVNITFPQNNSSVSGSSVNITASATDDVGVSTVNFYYRASTSSTLILISSDTVSPYITFWDTTLLAEDTTYILLAKANDADGNIGTSPEVSVRVNNVNSAPSISLNSPLGGESWTGSQNILWNASDPDGDNLSITLQVASNGSGWTDIVNSMQNLSTFTWNTTTLPNATDYWVRAIAQDPGGLTALAYSGFFILRNYPSDIGDLAASAAQTGSEITLTWTAPGADGTLGAASAYDIRYSTELLRSPAVNLSSFNAAGSVSIFAAIPAPANYGTVQSITLTGLTSNTSYYFAMRARDGVPLWNNISNGATAFTAPDVSSPSAITSLSTTSISGSQIRLSWISPGDDGTIGTLSAGSQFQIRYSTTSTDGWSATNLITISTSGVSAGSLRDRLITGLSAGSTYYFWIRTQDEVGNLAPLSNTATGQTPAGKLTYQNKTIDGSLADWDNNTELLDLRNGNSFYFTWSSTAIYIAYAGPDADTASNDFFVVFDTHSDYTHSFGTGSPVTNWDGAEAHELPFKADFALTVEGAVYKAVRRWTGSAWNDPGDSGGIAAQSLGATVNEISILRSTLNNPASLRVLMLHKWDTQKNVYNSYPPENPAPNTDTVVYFSHFYDIPDLGSGVTPKNSVHVASVSLVDNTAPSAITNLTALVGANKGEINLSWTSPGDDGTSGALAGGKFRIDYSTTATTNFVYTTYKIEITANNNPGDTLNRTIQNLTAGVTYYFRVWTKDDTNNWSAISNGATNYSGPDTTAPSVVTALSALTGVNEGQIRLTWIAPGDDGTTGTAASYTIKFATASELSPAISDSNFNSAQNLNSTSPVPSPAIYGTQQAMVVTGLMQGVTYYFALKAQDAGNNSSLLSNGATAWAQVSVPTPDTAPPSQITDLSAQTGTGTGEIILSWSAPGNDGTTGNNLSGAVYQLKYATYSVSGGSGGSTTTWWNNAQTYSQSWTVSPRGTKENKTVTLTASTTYYFGIKTADAAGNVSILDLKSSSGTANVVNIRQAESGTLSGGATTEAGGTGTVVKLSASGQKVSVTVDNTVTGINVAVWGRADNSDTAGQFAKPGTNFNLSSWSTSFATNTANTNWTLNSGNSLSLEKITGGAGTTLWVDYFIVTGGFNEGTAATQANAVAAQENDTTAPSAITDLLATQGSAAGEVKLSWSSPGDDGLSGSISGGKYRIDYSTDPGKNWAVNSYQIELNTNTTPGDSQGTLIAGLTSGATYFFRVWTADEKPNWSEISSGATAWAMTGSVSIVMDGIKDSAWGTTPLATSVGFKLPDNRARDLYAISDANYLYLGFQFNGDPWDDAEGAKSAHFNFLIDTGTASGVTTDPWMNTTSVNWSDKPDIAVNGWVNGTAATNFGGMTRYRAQGTAWDTGTALVSGTDFSANKNNDWAEFRIPRSALGVENGQSIKILHFFRPAEDKPGVTDSTPYDDASGAVNDWGNSGSVLSQFVTYKFPGGDETAPASVTGIAADPGNNAGEILLSWNMPGDDGWSGNISGGKFRIAYSSNASTNFQISNYQIEKTTNATPNTTHYTLLTGLSGGDTYYIRLWVADEVPNWSGISLGATTWARPPPPPAPVFTPTIDGTKDASWGSQPNATSSNFKLPSDRARDLYVTNDANYLYIGFQFNGDPWGAAESNNLNAHYIFLIDSNTVSGTSADPWVNTTQVNWTNKPDVAVAGWHNKNSSANSINGMTRYLSNGTSWDSGTTLSSGTDFASSVSNDWAEFRVPLAVLRSSSGVQLRIVHLFRPDENKPGVSDSTPFDSAGTSDWGNGNPATISQSFIYTLRSVGDVIAPVAVTNLSALQGSVEGSIQLSWSAPGNDGNTGTLLSGSQFAIQYSSQTSVTWSTSSAQIVISTAGVNPTTNIQYQISNLQSGDTYYFRVWTKDEANNWSAISQGATNWVQVDVTSPSVSTTLAASPGNKAGEIKLTWLAPGDDGTTGTATTYEIRYSTSFSESPAISLSNFNLATQVSSVPLPALSGSTQTVTVTGLDEGKTYYFAMRARDERGNLSPLSNGATTFAQFDLISPSAITDLSALVGINHGEVRLTWTNPGDDGTSGNLTGFYRIVYSTNASENWSLTNYKIQVATTNAIPLSQQSVTLTGLSTNATYYFRVWVGDEQTNEKSPNWSALSNGATAQSVASAQITVTKSRTPNSPRPGEEITYTVTFGNTGTGAAQNFVIKDRIPDNTDFSTGTIKLNGAAKTDAADSDEANFDNDMKVITVNFGILGSGVTGQTVEFKVKVK